MKNLSIKFLILSIIFSNISLAFSKFQATNFNKKPEIYAVVIGISDYKDDQIKDLQYADRDAKVFAEYLQSENGGSVPANHIKLLLGKDATIAAVYNALQWVKDNVAENDQFYFYFAGHGDVESSIYSLGFLLVYDTPFQNYLNNAIRLEDLNNITNTLSVNTAANSILITDACHSGKLAGNENKGKSLVGEQLSKVLNKEIRITSCKANELSQEGSNWGDGRGVFSYYLIKGLNGEADDATDPDGLITLRELTTYLDNKVSTDVFKKLNEDQNPVIDGDNKNKIISRVIQKPTTDLLTVAKSPMAANDENLNSRDISENSSKFSQVDSFFDNLKNQDLSAFLDFNKLLTDKKTDISLELLRISQENNLIDESNLKQLNTILSNPKDLQYFNHKLAETLHNQVQNVINLYLEGDETELEKRQYYNSKSNLYSKYPQMIKLAMNLLNKNEYLYRILEVKYHYFSGVVYRLKIPAAQEFQTLIDSSLTEQLIAYKLEPNAAYINNELGILYKINKDYITSKNYFNKATELAPSWAIPWANLSAWYLSQKDYKAGLTSAQKAISIQPNYKGAIDNLGYNYEKLGNLLYAEEQYRKSEFLNYKSYFSFERLGNIYLQTGKFDLADNFFYEAEKRKKGFNPKLTDMDADGISNILDQQSVFPPCMIDYDFEKKKDIMACYYFAKTSFNENRTKPDQLQSAKNLFLILIKMDPENPVAYRYLAEIDCLTSNYIEAEQYIKLAYQFHLDDVGFSEHFNKWKAIKKEKNKCVEDFYNAANFNAMELQIMEGKMYEHWGNYSKAEIIYKNIEKSEFYKIIGNLLLSNLQFSLQRYDECEFTLKSFENIDSIFASRNLYSFYLKMLKNFPDNLSYYRKAGNLLYHSAMFQTNNWQNEEIKAAEPEKPESEFPKMNAEMNPFKGELIPGTFENYTFAPSISYPHINGVKMYTKLIELLHDSLEIAEAYEKSGDLYLHVGGKIHALHLYDKASSYHLNNSGIRWKLTDLSDGLSQFELGFLHLSYLYNHQQINNEKLLQLTNYTCRYGDFVLADSCIKQIAQLRNDNIVIMQLKAQRYLLAKQWDNAIDNLKALNKVLPDDYNVTYKLSRVYAFKNDYIQAYSWLKKSKSLGFEDKYVVDYDTAWSPIKENPKLKPDLNMLLASIPQKDYTIIAPMLEIK